MNNNRNKFKIIFLTIFTLFITFVGLPCVGDEAETQAPAQRFDSYTLKGQIQVNPDCKHTPGFRVLFDGQQVTSNQGGSYTFPNQDKKLEKYRLIICKNFKQNFDKINTIENLSVTSDKPYKYFSFKMTGTTEKGEDIWKKKDKGSLEKKNFIVPSKCIIAQINPKYVDKVDVWNINLAGNFIKLPKIVLKDDIDEQKLKREANKSLLYSLESVPFHEAIKEKERKDARISEQPVAQVVLSQ